MSNQIIPDDLNLMERVVVSWVLNAIKLEILSGRPSGQVIDEAICQAYPNPDFVPAAEEPPDRKK